MRISGHLVKTRTRHWELPPSQNDHVHPQVRGRWVKDWRRAARDAARMTFGLGCRLERVRVTLVVRRTRLGTADPDNDLSRIKPILDGMRDAGVLIRDTHGHVEFGPVTEERAGADGPGMLLIVEEV